MKLRELGEFGLIAHCASRLTQREGVLTGIGDDAAVLSSLQTPVVTCDALVEEVHFRRDWSTPFQLGRKAMSVNVSDLAAKGAQPVAAFVTLALGKPLIEDEGAARWLEALYDGMESAAAQYGCTVAGGDTVRTARETMLSVTLIGDAGSALALPLRAGARERDIVMVTGTLGDAAAGLFLLQHPEVEVPSSTRDYLVERHLNPEARLAAGLAATRLPGGALTASLDLSDGLAGDAAHIARRSQVQIEISLDALPISEACREAAHAAQRQGFGASPQQWALYGGEDYELLWCISPGSVASVSQGIGDTAGVAVTQIGRCAAWQGGDAPVIVRNAQGRPIELQNAWTHF